MGLFDYFEPHPPIGCARPQCTGKVHGWQGKHENHLLYVWRQAQLAPVDHSVDKSIKFSPQKLAAVRLPVNSVIRASAGKCDTCGNYSGLDLDCITNDQGLWTETRIEGKSSSGDLIAGWLICSNCFASWEHTPGKTVYRCPGCESVIQMPSAVEQAAKPPTL